KLAQSFFGRAPLFGLGVLVAWICRRCGARLTAWASRTAWLRRGGADLLLLATLMSLAFLLREGVFLGYFEAELQWQPWHLIEGALWATVMLLLLLAPLATRWLFSNRLWRTLGLLSYSIYVIHYPLIAAFHFGPENVAPVIFPVSPVSLNL